MSNLQQVPALSPKLDDWTSLVLSNQRSFSLDCCLNSGQSFGWSFTKGIWKGSIRDIGFLLKQKGDKIFYKASCSSERSAKILANYLSLEEDHELIAKSFPTDPFLSKAVLYSPGLKILRQDPWECLAGFILSSTKQIVHIQQIWKKLCERYGDKVSVSETSIHCFPTALRLSQCSEVELRGCGMGFRAPYLLNAAQKVVSGGLLLEHLKNEPISVARMELMKLHGVGRKIADCVLLFSLDKSEAFPIDTWILKVLKKIYFSKKRKIDLKRLIEFSETHFGLYAGHAQQYLFHYARMNPEFVKTKEKQK
jgi:N-glycosylase/DNA lyase